MNINIIIKIFFETVIKPLYLDFIQKQIRIKKAPVCTKERADAIKELRKTENRIYNILGAKNPRILKDRVVRLYNGLYGEHYDLSNRDAEALGLKFLLFKPSTTIRIHFLNKYNNLIVIQYVDADKMYNIAIFSDKKEKANFIKALDFYHKKSKKDFVEKCRKAKNIESALNIKSYADLYNTKPQNKYVKNCINSFWGIRKINISPKEKSIINAMKGQPKKDLIIHQIVDEFDSYATVQFVYDEYINITNFYDIIKDIDDIMKKGIREDLFIALKELKIYMLENETDLFNTENNSVEHKTRIEDYF